MDLSINDLFMQKNPVCFINRWSQQDHRKDGTWQMERHVYHSAPCVSSLFANWGRRLLSRSENGNAFFITRTFMLIRNIQLLPEINWLWIFLDLLNPHIFLLKSLIMVIWNIKPQFWIPQMHFSEKCYLTNLFRIWWHKIKSLAKNQIPKILKIFRVWYALLYNRSLPN